MKLSKKISRMDDDGLIDGYICPICKRPFKDQYNCAHSFVQTRAEKKRLEKLQDHEEIKKIVYEHTPPLTEERIREIVRSEMTVILEGL